VKVTVGLIMSHGFPVPAPFVQSWTRMLQALLTGEFNDRQPSDRRIDSVRVVFSHAFPTDVARNEIVRIFLDHDRDSRHLLFLDTDMTHPPDLPYRLLRHTAPGYAVPLDIVTARYVMRRAPFFSVAMRRTGDGPNDYQAVEKLVPLDQVFGLMPVDAGGAGALLLSRRLLNAMREKNGDDWFRYQDGPAGRRSVSEDMWCYEQARALGFQPYLDADCECGHVASFEVNSEYHRPYADAFLRVQKGSDHGEADRRVEHGVERRAVGDDVRDRADEPGRLRAAAPRPA
jgi:hypothetical protein